MLEVVNKYIEEIKSMEGKINLNLFEEFFESSSPADYAKMLINTKNADENKENVKDIKCRISDLKDRIKKMSVKEKKDKNADETLEIIQKILDFNKDAQNFFILHQKLIRKNQNQNKNLINQFLNECKCQKIDLILWSLKPMRKKT